MTELVLLVVIVVLALAIGKWLSRRRRRVPILKVTDIEPVDAPISTVDAKKIYRQYMVARARGDREELRFWVETFADEMREEGESMRLEIADDKKTVADGKARIKALQAEIKKIDQNDDRLPALQEELDDVIEDTEWYVEHVDELRGDLQRFKKDKRAFLINYINTELHGPDWWEYT